MTKRSSRFLAILLKTYIPKFALVAQTRVKAATRNPITLHSSPPFLVPGCNKQEFRRWNREAGLSHLPIGCGEPWSNLLLFPSYSVIGEFGLTLETHSPWLTLIGRFIRTQDDCRTKGAGVYFEIIPIPLSQSKVHHGGCLTHGSSKTDHLPLSGNMVTLGCVRGSNTSTVYSRASQSEHMKKSYKIINKTHKALDGWVRAKSRS